MAKKEQINRLIEKLKSSSRLSPKPALTPEVIIMIVILFATVLTMSALFFLNTFVLKR